MKFRLWLSNLLRVEPPLRHYEVDSQLEEQQEQLDDHARRLRRLENEVGIIKPPLRKVSN
jgi:hypothetical protein